MNTIKIIRTEDGSQSLLNEEMNETYHSRHGAVQESNYVFIEKGLNFLTTPYKIPLISILEVGFGTGLNAWLTLQRAKVQQTKIRYQTLETYPLPKEIWQKLTYHSNQEEAGEFQKLHQVAWDQWTEINQFFNLYKINQSLQSVSLAPLGYDLIFFDAFAPAKQPEMWEQPMLEKVVIAMKAGAVFVTYCAKGQLKRDLKFLGLEVESLPGPPGKREMVRAIKI